jgi:hypothetical protein
MGGSAYDGGCSARFMVTKITPSHVPVPHLVVASPDLKNWIFSDLRRFQVREGRDAP